MKFSRTVQPVQAILGRRRLKPKSGDAIENEFTRLRIIIDDENDARFVRKQLFRDDGQSGFRLDWCPIRRRRRVLGKPRGECRPSSEFTCNSQVATHCLADAATDSKSEAGPA